MIVINLVLGHSCRKCTGEIWTLPNVNLKSNSLLGIPTCMILYESSLVI
jgi:hypothetical protein